MNREELWGELAALPREAQQQVMDFIAFLRTRYALPCSNKKAERGDLADEPFIGMWRDWQDMGNSSSWVWSESR